MFKFFNNKGFSLLETTVAMGIFSVVITVSMGAFLLTIKAQKVVTTEKAIAENLNFALEFMSRQMRVAASDTSGSCISSGDTFEIAGSSEISFINANQHCVRFFLASGVLIYENITTSSGNIPLTDSSAADIDSLLFLVQGESDGDSEQPRATISISASGAGNSPESQGVQFSVQTTISARELDLN